MYTLLWKDQKPTFHPFGTVDDWPPPALPAPRSPGTAAEKPAEPHGSSPNWLYREDHPRRGSSAPGTKLCGRRCSLRCRILTASGSDHPTGRRVASFQQCFQASAAGDPWGVFPVSESKRRKGAGGKASGGPERELAPQPSTAGTPPWAHGPADPTARRTLAAPPLPRERPAPRPRPRPCPGKAPPRALGPAPGEVAGGPTPWQPEGRFLLSNQCGCRHG